MIMIDTETLTLVPSMLPTAMPLKSPTMTPSTLPSESPLSLLTHLPTGNFIGRYELHFPHLTLCLCNFLVGPSTTYILEQSKHMFDIIFYSRKLFLFTF